MLPARPCRPRPRPSGPRPPRGAREFRGTGNAHLMTRRRLRFGVRGVENLPCRPDKKAATRVFFISRRVCLRPRGSRTLPVPRVPSGPARPFPAFLASSQACRAPKYYSLASPCARATPSLRPSHVALSSMSIDLDSRPPLLRQPTSADLWLHALAGASSLRCLGSWVEDRRAVRYGPPRRPTRIFNLFTCLCWVRPPSDIYLFKAMMCCGRRRLPVKTDASKR